MAGSQQAGDQDGGRRKHQARAPVIGQRNGHEVEERVGNGHAVVPHAAQDLDEEIYGGE